MVQVRRVEEADSEDRRQKIAVIILFSIGMLVLSYLIYDYVQIMNFAAMPENLAEVDPVISSLRAEGLVHSLDISASKMTVDPLAWGGRSKAEKTGIITQLARYCVEKNNQRTWSLRVVANPSGVELGGIGPSGLKVY